MRKIIFAALVTSMGASVQAQTLHGASQFNDDHAFTKAMVKFEELMKKYSGGKSVNFVLHKNSELGLEKQYFEYMAQGKAVDYAIVSPAHMSTFSKAAPFIDALFLFRDLAHWNKVLDADILKPVADEIAQKADVMLIGYAGGGTRNIFVNKPVKNLAEIKGLKVRVQGAPIWSKTFKKLDKNLQAAVLKAGKEAGAYGRQIESSEDEQKLVKLEKEGKLKRVPFSDRAQMKKLVDPVMADYAKEIGAEQILAKINGIK